MPVQFEVQRTFKRQMASSRLGGPTEICSDNRGAVHGLKKKVRSVVPPLITMMPIFGS